MMPTATKILLAAGMANLIGLWLATAAVLSGL